MSINVAALEEDAAPSISLLHGETVTASGSSDSLQGFDAFRSVYVIANVRSRKRGFFRRSALSPLLTLLVEHSDDGSSWTTAHAFTFTDSASDSAVVSSPKAYMRASWTVGAGEWSIGSVAVLPSFLDSQSGGGSLPSQWTVDDAGSVFIEPDAGGSLEAPLAVRIPTGLTAALRLVNDGDQTVFLVDSEGVLSTGGSASLGYDQDVTQLFIDGSANTLHDIVQARAPGSFNAGVQVDGGLFTELTSTPADAHLFSSRMVLWFDNTEGAAKLMVKAKDAAGNIVAGEVTLL